MSWRLGAADGQEIGRSSVASLAAGGVYEAAYLWDTSGRYSSSAFVPVFAVADEKNVVLELDEANNAYPQSVRVVPAWVPRLLEARVLATGTARLTFEATSYPAAAFAVESTGSLASPIQRIAEPNAVITTNAPGRLEAQLPQQETTRFYRVRTSP